MRATIHLMPAAIRREFIFLEDDKVAALVEKYRAGVFTESKEVVLDHPMDTEAMANECFDLTNNPGRQEERELVYGTGRSVSVGDIVEVEHPRDPEKTESWLCMSFGWKYIA